MALEDDVVTILESVTDRRAAAGLVVTLVRAAIAAEAAAELRAAVERGKAERREAERARKADYRSRLSRDVPTCPRDTAGQDGTSPPLDPPSDPASSLVLSLLPDPERAIPLLEFPVVGGGGGTWGLFGDVRDVHQRAFPALDVMAEYRKALAFVVSNPAKRKTAKGMPRFLFAWLAREQNAGRGHGRQLPQVVRGAPLPPTVKPDPKTPPERRGWANGVVR